MIICICGSMRFFDEMLTVAREETLNGNIVLMPYSFKDTLTTEQQDFLDQLHFDKIDLADRVLVVTNQVSYIGHSTSKEIEYAVECGKFDPGKDLREYAREI